MIYELMCDEKHFEKQICGIKTFEVRRNVKDYQVGDFIALNEVKEEIVYEDSVDYVYTGRSALFFVSYVEDSEEECKPGYVILGIKPCRVNVCDRVTELTLMKRLDDE